MLFRSGFISLSLLFDVGVCVSGDDGSGFILLVVRKLWGRLRY